MALALGAIDHATTLMALVDFMADKTTAHRAGHGGRFAAIAAPDLITHQTADQRASHCAPHIAIALG